MSLAVRHGFLVLSLLLCLLGCTSVSAQALAVRDGTVSANSEGAVIDATASLAESMRRVEQDQLIARAVLDKSKVEDLRIRIAETRALWAKTLALLDVARAVHVKLLAELKTTFPREAFIQAYVTELHGALTSVYEEITAARKRITERK